MTDNATYSASIDDRAIIICFLDRQLIAPPADKKMYLDVDFWSSAFAYAASAYPWNTLFSVMTVGIYMIPKFLVPAKYLSTLFNAVPCCISKIVSSFHSFPKFLLGWQ